MITVDLGPYARPIYQQLGVAPAAVQDEQHISKALSLCEARSAMTKREVHIARLRLCKRIVRAVETE